jgi:hypothetical protein
MHVHADNFDCKIMQTPLFDYDSETCKFKCWNLGSEDHPHVVEVSSLE